jgi:hypothetical protein
MKRIDAATAQQIEDKFAEEVRTQSADRSTVRKRKTGHPVPFELNKGTREAVDDYIRPPQEGVAKSSSSQPTPAGLLLDAGRRAGGLPLFAVSFLFRLSGPFQRVDVSAAPRPRLGRATAPVVSWALSKFR